MSNTEYVAIEIDSPKIWEMLCGLVPHLSELNFEENLGSFIVPNFEGVGWAIMTPQTVAAHFDRIEKPSLKITTVQLIK